MHISDCKAIQISLHFLLTTNIDETLSAGYNPFEKSNMSTLECFYVKPSQMNSSYMLYKLRKQKVWFTSNAPGNVCQQGKRKDVN